MKLFVAALLLVSAFAIEDPKWEQFNEFMIKYNRTYESLDETQYRFGVFKMNLDRIAKQNEDHIRAGGEAIFGVNIFADQTPEEFSVRLMKDLPYREPDMTPFTNRVVPNGVVDWRTKGAVTPVKDQGSCGSCWAHSADEAQESFYQIQHGTLIVQSVQQCTACTYTYNGCNGGWPHDAYTNGIQKRKGIDSNADYPYNIAQAGNCKFGATGTADKPVSNDNGYKSPSKGQLQSMLDSTGPLSVCVAAQSWSSYHSGVMTSCTGSVDHCVQAVGYNSDANPPYWIVRNSWGTSWGVQGYIYLSMTADGGDICHIQEYMTYPTTILP